LKACQTYEVWARDNGVSSALSHTGPNSNPTQHFDISTFGVQMGVRFFEGIPRSDRASILRAAAWRRFTKTSIATNQGDNASQVFLLVKGSARFFFLTPQGEKVYLIWLKSGDIFGGASMLINPSLYLVSTEVAKGSRTFIWQRDTIRSLAARFPRLLENALSIGYDQMTWYVARHLSLISHSAQERLAHVLIGLSDGIGQNLPDGIHLHVTNEQLANTANISIFTASRLLSTWQRKNILKKRRNQIILRYPEQLLLAG
jgi:CRP/FNR family transcriptional regulator, nitrogen oxide reductase regulator